MLYCVLFRGGLFIQCNLYIVVEAVYSGHPYGSCI